MARKVKFALEMADGTKVRSNLEELREHFDMESIVSYYLSGKLLEWLEDRYYDDEAAKIEELDKDSPNLNAQLCAIIGVDASKYDALDLEAVERLNEKKTILRQKTSDSTIIDNAMITALNQEDLADLLDLESPVIYLCGEKFNIPIRVEHKKYIGILGTPKIEIRASSDADLKTKDILFENVILPWTNITSSTQSVTAMPVAPQAPNADIPSASTEELFELWNTAVNKRKNDLKYIYDAVDSTWEPISEQGEPNDDIDFNSGKIKIALRTVCKNQYAENDIAKALIADDFSSACIFTTNSVCLYDKNKLKIVSTKGEHSETTNMIIRYSDIADVNIKGELPYSLSIQTTDKTTISTKTDYDKDDDYGIPLGFPISENSVWYLSESISNFLNAAKNI